MNIIAPLSKPEQGQDSEFHLEKPQQTLLPMTVRHSWRNSHRRGAFIADFLFLYIFLAG